MQNRYVGDVGDFGKYGLLRHLQTMPEHSSLGVVWYLVPNENHNGDGRHTGYLNRSECFCSLDPVLFHVMNDIVVANTRTVDEIKTREVLGAGASYFDLSVRPVAGANRQQYRSEWVCNALSAVKGRNLVFLDPDNGVGGDQFLPYGPRGHKHAGWDEIEKFADEGSRTLVIYHHTGRNGTRCDQAKALVEKYREKVSASEGAFALGFRRGTHRIFVVAPRKGLRDEVKKSLVEFQEKWDPHFEWLVG